MAARHAPTILKPLDTAVLCPDLGVACEDRIFYERE